MKNPLTTITQLLRLEYRSIGLGIAGLATLIASFLGPITPAQAAPESCGLAVTIIAAPFAVVDSNKPGVEGPRVAALGARITNTGGAVVNDVTVEFSGNQLSLINGSPASYYLNDLAAGESITAYWPVTYPATFDVGYGYTISASNADGCMASSSSVLTTQSEISANSNKLLPTGATVSVNPSVVTPGSLVTVRITGFTLGTIGQGPNNNYDAWLQPIGNLGFDPTCLRLVRSEVKLNSISGAAFIDQLYFTYLNNYRSDPRDYVAYTFLGLRSCTTVIQPYQEAASGTQEKYNSDFSASTSFTTLTSDGSSALTITVQADKTNISANDTVRYAVTFSAPSAPVGYPDNGNPVVISAGIPDETTYVAGSATTISTADLQYSTDDGATWSDGEPAAADVTDLRWVLQTQVSSEPAQVQFAVVVDSTYSGAPLTTSVSGSLLDGSTLTSTSSTVTATPTSTPTPTPSPTPTATPSPTPPANTPPTAVDDSIEVAMNTAITFDVLANDTDPDGNLDPSRTVATTMPAHGTLASNGNGLFVYTPAPGYIGLDGFNYRACDTNLACDGAVVTLFVGYEQLRWRTYTTAVAYEDLKNAGWSDWDYNDFIVHIRIKEGLDPADRLAALQIDYDALARGAGYYQRFFHKLPLNGGGLSMLSVRDGSGNVVRQRTAKFTDDTTFMIFTLTRDALPPLPGFFDTNTRNTQPGVVPGGTATLTIYTTDPSANAAAALPPKPWDPYIYVGNTQQEVHLLIPGHLDNTQTVNGAFDPSSPLIGYDLPLAQTFQPGWQWPSEFSGIWRAYPSYVGYIGTGGVSNQDWWQAQNAASAWLWSPGRSSVQHVPVSGEAPVTSRYFASPVVADLDGNGQAEIVIGNLLENRVEVYDVDRNPVAGWPQPVGGSIKAAAAVVDLDGDGLLEVVVGAADGKLYAWRHDGQPLAGWPVTLNPGFRVLATPAVGDLDGDGVLDIVAPVANGKLYAVDANGVLKAGWPVSIGDVPDLYNSQVINSSPRIVDLDGDGTLEIVVGSTDKRVYAFHGNGSVRWTYQTGDMVLSTPAVADIDPASPGLETVVGSGDSYVYLLNSSGGLIWRRATGWTVRSSPAVADLDGDQDLEIVIGGDDDKVWAWHHTGHLVAGWPQTTGADVFSSPAIGDVDGDGRPEVVVGSDDAKVYAWKANGTLLPGWPKATEQSVKGMPALANLDTDHALEVVAADFAGALYIWDHPTEAGIQAVFLPLVSRGP